MAFQQLTLSLLALVAVAYSRDVNKPMKALPTISNSLVNLGKMEISFYIGKPENGDKHTVSSLPFNLPIINGPRTIIEEEPCPCTQFASRTDSIRTIPSDLINKILMSNDLFKNPTSSFCCDSHENGHESTFFFELSPNQASQTRPFKFPTLPLNKPLPAKPKAVEIFLFPKRKDLANFEFQKMTPLRNIVKNIEKVGKEITFETPLNDEKMSVKKDLTDLEKKKKVDEGNSIDDNKNEDTTVSPKV